MKKTTLLAMMMLLTIFITGCACKHEWVEATCTEPKTCSKCGETEGEPLGHDFIRTDCTKLLQCTRCGEERGVTGFHKLYGCVCEKCGMVVKPDFEKLTNTIYHSDDLSITCGDNYALIDSNENDGAAQDDDLLAEAVRVAQFLNEELGLPDSVYQRILNTTNIDGKQSETIEKITVTWSYSRYKGLEIMYEFIK